MEKIKKSCMLVTTDKLIQCRDFYVNNFNFKVTFEADNYVGLVCQKNKDGLAPVELGFMPANEPQPVFDGKGISLCLEVDDVDAEFKRLSAAGFEAVLPLKDNPWGDRSFAIVDPCGVSVYIYKQIEPSAQYKDAVKE